MSRLNKTFWGSFGRGFCAFGGVFSPPKINVEKEMRKMERLSGHARDGFERDRVNLFNDCINGVTAFKHEQRDARN